MNCTAAGPGPARMRAGVPARSAAEPGVRLTRRGRAVVVGAVLAGSLTGGLALTPRSSIAAGDVPPPRDYAYVVVQPGETLWEIARAAAPGVDPRATIQRIVDLNALAGAHIRAGQRIALP